MLRFKVGFSVVEIAIVLSVVGFLLMLIVPKGFSFIKKAETSVKQSNLDVVAKQCVVYFNERGVWPSVSEDLKGDVTDNVLVDIKFINHGRYLIVSDGQFQSIAYSNDKL